MSWGGGRRLQLRRSRLLRRQRRLPPGELFAHGVAHQPMPRTEAAHERACGDGRLLNTEGGSTREAARERHCRRWWWWGSPLIHLATDERRDSSRLDEVLG